MDKLDLENIRHVTSDSREVGPDSIFVAIAGNKEDGHKYIVDAINRGAKIIVCAHDFNEPNHPDKVQYFPVMEPRVALSEIAAALYTPKPDNIVAVTGTSGKTSVAFYFKQIVEMLGKSAASVGTLGVIATGFTKVGALTTPNTADLHRTLQDLAKRDINYVALEASSHGLHQYRLDSVILKAAAITNFSHEHLDYHHSMEEYFNAKMRLFKALLPRTSPAIINADMEEYQTIATICKKRDIAVLSYGFASNWLELREVKQTSEHLLVRMVAEGKDYTLKYKHIIGEFQAYNILCAVGLAVACGFNLPDALAVTTNLISAPGRMQKIDGHNVFVDYAHKAQALEKALQTLRAGFPGKIIIVFGCGGDRDREKRPIMGAIASKYADLTIVTDDNPRSENPISIRAAILASCPNAVEIGDRKQAIAYAIENITSPNDAVLIAGKGHETYQIVGDKVVDFDDFEIAKQHLAAKPER